ncbi:MAG: glutaredoxin [Planctomycetes bacterium]|jgi:monothiol glutaredoxin|nr:glutaredoxin [Planctomycetota bacterium]|tara:strand:+ start:1091 stop:1408 length:318 start_codon:yes stop_codon:yes gene_type:complete
MTDLKQQLEQAIADNHVLVFAKGNKMFPRCGFSKAVVEVFVEVGCDFEVIDIFEHQDIKPTLISITDWPTTPQIFIGGEFVGGGDLVRELHARGELAPMVAAATE